MTSVQEQADDISTRCKGPMQLDGDIESDRRRDSFS